MLLELIFSALLNNIPDGRTDARTDNIPSSRAPVGAKNEVEQTKHILRQAFKKNNVIKTSILKIFLIRPLFKRSFFEGFPT